MEKRQLFGTKMQSVDTPRGFLLLRTQTLRRASPGHAGSVRRMFLGGIVRVGGRRDEGEAVSGCWLVSLLARKAADTNTGGGKMTMTPPMPAHP